MQRDNWLTHYSHYLASVRALVYSVTMLGRFAKASGMDRSLLASVKEKASKRADELETQIRQVYRGDNFSYNDGKNLEGLGQNYGIFSRVVDGQYRCSTLRSWLKSAGTDDLQHWVGAEEKLFSEHLQPSLYKEQAQNRLINTGSNLTTYVSRHGIRSGIFDIKYTFKTLSDMGFVELALEKASSTLDCGISSHQCHFMKIS
jgi:hypothetical protein